MFSLSNSLSAIFYSNLILSDKKTTFGKILAINHFSCHQYSSILMKIYNTANPSWKTDFLFGNGRKLRKINLSLWEKMFNRHQVLFVGKTAGVR
jgi:hypothetical protein